MNFLGMGPMELVVILVLALIVFGPGKLPEVAGQIGRMVRDFRRTTSEMSSEFNEAFKIDLDEPAKSSSSSSASPTPTEAPPTIAPPGLPSGASAASGTSSVQSGTETAGEKAAANRRDDLLPPY